MKTLFKIISGLILSLIALILFTPYPASRFVRLVFEGGVAVKPDDYEQIATKVVQHNNIQYPSKFKDNTLDILSPRNRLEPLPVIIWVHGGAFVAGDKSDITEYAVQIAVNGYHVVNMNYERAPKGKYPTPLHQLQEVYTFVTQHAQQYGFNMDKVFLAGDSAGAQIVAQFANIQTNTKYAKQLQFEQTIPSNTLRGLLLYCGPYDIQKLDKMSDNKIISFLLKRVGWAYLGTRNWQSAQVAKDASPIDYVTESFPPSFITDGTVMTFDEHGKDFVKRLEEHNVDVTSIFFDQVELPHEFQFMMDLKEAVEVFHMTLQFLHTKAAD